METLYLLFKNLNPAKADFTVAEIDLVMKTYKVYSTKNYIPFYPTEFIATQDALMIGGHFNYRPLVLYFSLFDHKTKVLPGFFNDLGELLQIKSTRTAQRISLWVQRTSTGRNACGYGTTMAKEHCLRRRGSNQIGIRI